MPTPISPEEAARRGVRTLHEVMDNGERRYRLTFSDGTSYIRTEAPEESRWQNSHLHRSFRELNVVQSGRVICAEEDGANGLRICQYGPGEVFIAEPGIPHNSCFAPGTVVHTVKFGHITPGDWVPCPGLDRRLADLDPAALLRECWEKP